MTYFSCIYLSFSYRLSICLLTIWVESCKRLYFFSSISLSFWNSSLSFEHVFISSVKSSILVLKFSFSFYLLSNFNNYIVFLLVWSSKFLVSSEFLVEMSSTAYYRYLHKFSNSTFSLDSFKFGSNLETHSRIVVSSCWIFWYYYLIFDQAYKQTISSSFGKSFPTYFVPSSSMHVLALVWSWSRSAFKANLGCVFPDF